jgi:septal ring factor EnvC (AmiA/AmiB activator)
MRAYRITFVGGLAIGYVLGAQAGRERYEQLKRLARKATESPAMQQTAGALQAQATSTAKTARSKATATVRSARDQAAAKVTTGMRKGSAKLTRHKPEPGKAATAQAAAARAEAAAAQAEAAAAEAAAAEAEEEAAAASAAERSTAMPQQPGPEDRRPFVPVKGGFGDNDALS